MKDRRSLTSTCVLQIDLQCCKACPLRIKKKLQKISGVDSITIDVDKGRVEVSGEVEPSTIVKELTVTLGRIPELTSFEKNSPRRLIKINKKKKKDDDSRSDSADEDPDDHGAGKNVKDGPGLGNRPSWPNWIVPPMHQQCPHYNNVNNTSRGNSYFPAGGWRPYSVNGNWDLPNHYGSPTMFRPPPHGYEHGRRELKLRPPPPDGYGHGRHEPKLTPPPPHRYGHGYRTEPMEAPPPPPHRYGPKLTPPPEHRCGQGCHQEPMATPPAPHRYGPKLTPPLQHAYGHVCYQEPTVTPPPPPHRYGPKLTPPPQHAYGHVCYQEPMGAPPPPPHRYGHGYQMEPVATPPPSRGYGHGYQEPKVTRQPVPNSPLQFFSDDNHETYCTAM